MLGPLELTDILNSLYLIHANKVPQHIKDKYSDVSWSAMYLLLNKVSHEYFGIDYEIIWDVITNHLPANKNQIQKILDSV